jgi:hypothetical protein
MGKDEKPLENVERSVKNFPVGDVKATDILEEATENLSGGVSGKEEEPLMDLTSLLSDGEEKSTKDDGETPIIELTDKFSDDKDDLGTTGDKENRTLSEGDKIYDLVDVVEEAPHGGSLDHELDDEIVRRVSEIAEKIAREIVPGIAERLIREEIEKLKSGE